MRINKEKFVLQWHLTERCNLKCKHCYQDGDIKKEMNIFEASEVFDKFRKFIVENNYRGHINFTGGEPFVKYDLLKQLMKRCDETGITYGILTNGTMIDETLTEELSRCKNLSFVQMSLEGGKKVNDSIRGEGVFNKVMKAVKLLRREGIQTMISFTCSESNYKELRKLIWLCRLHRVDRFWTDRYVPIRKDEIEVLSTEHYREVIDVLKQEHRCHIGGLDVECKRALQGIDLGCGYRCSAGERLLVLLPDGEALPCRRLPMELGNIKEKSIEELLEESKRKFNPEERGECSGCDKWNMCHGGAKCLTYAVTGDTSRKDINCWYR